jgi:hypothetical protein
VPEVPISAIWTDLLQQFCDLDEKRGDGDARMASPPALAAPLT